MPAGTPIRHRPARRSFLRWSAGVATVLPLGALAGCSGSSRDPSTLRIAYQQFGSNTIKEKWIQGAAKEFSAQNPDLVVDLVPAVAQLVAKKGLQQPMPPNHT